MTREIKISAEVYAALWAFFGKRLTAAESYSNPSGDCPLGNGKPEMYTAFALDDMQTPLLSVRTTWERGENEWDRVNEKSEYWLHAEDGHESV